MKRLLEAMCVVLLTACSPKAGSAGAPQAWIDAPLDGMVLPLAPYQLVGHGNDPAGVSTLEFSVNGAVVGNPEASGPMFTGQQEWIPAAPGEYVIRVRAMGSGGGWSEYAEARVVVAGEAPTATQPGVTPTATNTPIPTATPTSTEPTLVLIMNANCRRGPSQVYEPLTSLLKDQVVPIIAANEESTWWLVKIPSGELCWISAITGTSSGNTGAVPLATAGPPPEEGCYVYDPNQNPVCTVPCPSNASPGGACSP